MKPVTPSLAPAPDTYAVEGAGLGLRRALLSPLADQLPEQISFLEVAPENWIGLGGRFAEQFRSVLERYPLLCHGLSLSIGGPAPLDETFLQQLKGCSTTAGAMQIIGRISKQPFQGR